MSALSKKPETAIAKRHHMFARMTMGEKIFDVVNILIMALFSIIILYPVLNAAAVSLSSDFYIYSGQVGMFPKGFNTFAYQKVLMAGSLWHAFGNSVFVAVFKCLFSLFMTCLAAYPLAFSKFYGKKIYTFMIMLTMWFSGGLVPTFMVMNRLGLVNNLWALVLLGMITAYNTVVLRSFFHSIPSSLIESAEMDGANEFRILFSIVIPLSKAALATIGLWVIVGAWNDFMHPLIYLKNYNDYTLQVVLRDVVLSNTAEQYGLQMGDDVANLVPDQIRNATIVFAMLPMLVVYPFLQKFFVKVVMIGSVKE